MSRDRVDKINKALMKSLLTIGYTNLSEDLGITLTNFGYYSSLSNSYRAKVRKARAELERDSATIFSIAKDDGDGFGRGPSDKLAEAEVNSDENIVESKLDLADTRKYAEDLEALVTGLTYKMDILRSLLADERNDKRLHIQNS